jgi:hypothetical protein
MEEEVVDLLPQVRQLLLGGTAAGADEAAGGAPPHLPEPPDGRQVTAHDPAVCLAPWPSGGPLP